MNYKVKILGHLLKYNCRHCTAEFQPKKRFVQKYCSGSCRVMACRDRKIGGLRGIKRTLKKTVTNAQILNTIEWHQEENQGKLDSIKKHIHYIEIGLIIQFLYDLYQNYRRNKNENVKDLLRQAIKQNPKFKDDLEMFAKSNPQYSEMLGTIL